MTFICAGFKRVRQRLGTIYGNGTLDAQATGINAAGPNGDGSGDSTITLPATPSTNQTITINNTGAGTVTVDGTITGGYSSAEMSAGATFTISWNGSTWDVDSESGTIDYIPAPTYATWNPADKVGDITLINGNLEVDFLEEGQFGVRSTLGKASGKWYWEYDTPSLPYSSPGFDPYLALGIANASGNLLWLVPSADGYGIISLDTGYKKVHSDTLTVYGSPVSDVIPINIGVALNMDDGEITFYINGVSLGVAFTGITGTFYAAYSGVASVDVSADITANFGATAFTYTPPVGYNSGLYT